MASSILPTVHPQRGVALQFDLQSNRILESSDWQVAGRRLRFLFLPPGRQKQLNLGRHFAKVVVGRLENIDRGCFAEPFAVRTTLLDTDVLAAGPEGALVALLTEGEDTPDRIVSMGDAQFLGSLADRLIWQSFETRFGQFMDVFNGLDCHMMDGIYLLDGSGEEIAYVNFWSCGKGVDLSTHNHGQDPREGAPAFAEVHWVIDAATSSSGMYRTAEPGHSERSRSPMRRGDEHGPYFEFDAQTGLPVLQTQRS